MQRPTETSSTTNTDNTGLPGATPPEGDQVVLTGSAQEALSTPVILASRTYWEALQDVAIRVRNMGTAITNWTGLLQKLGFTEWKPRQTWAELIAQKNAKSVFDHIEKAAREDSGNGQTMEVFLREVLHNFSQLFNEQNQGHLTQEQTEQLKNLWKLVTDALDSKPFPLLYTLFHILKEGNNPNWYETDNIFRVLTRQYPAMFLDLVLLAAKNAGSLHPAGRDFFKDLLSYIWQTNDNDRLVIIASYLINFMQKEPPCDASAPAERFALVAHTSNPLQALNGGGGGGGGGGGAPPEREGRAPDSLITDEEETRAVLRLLRQIPHPQIYDLVRSKARDLIQYRHPTSFDEVIQRFEVDNASFHVLDAAFVLKPFMELGIRCRNQSAEQKPTKTELTEAAQRTWSCYLESIRRKFEAAGITGLDENEFKKRAIQCLLNQITYSPDPALHHSMVDMFTEMSVCLDPMALTNFIYALGTLTNSGRALKKIGATRAATDLLRGNIPEGEGAQKRAGGQLFDIAKNLLSMLSDESLMSGIKEQVVGFIAAATAAASLPVAALNVGRSGYKLAQSVDLTGTSNAFNRYLRLSASITPGYNITTLEEIQHVIENDTFKAVFNPIVSEAMKAAIRALMKKTLSGVQKAIINKMWASTFSIAMAPIAVAVMPLIGPFAAAAMVPLLLGAAQKTNAWSELVELDKGTSDQNGQAVGAVLKLFDQKIRDCVESLTEKTILYIGDLKKQSADAAQSNQRYYASGHALFNPPLHPPALTDGGGLTREGGDAQTLAVVQAAKDALKEHLSPENVLGALQDARRKALEGRRSRMHASVTKLRLLMSSASDTTSSVTDSPGGFGGGGGGV